MMLLIKLTERLMIKLFWTAIINKVGERKKKRLSALIFCLHQRNWLWFPIKYIVSARETTPFTLSQANCCLLLDLNRRKQKRKQNIQWGEDKALSWSAPLCFNSHFINVNNDFSLWQNVLYIQGLWHSCSVNSKRKWSFYGKSRYVSFKWIVKKNEQERAFLGCYLFTWF